MFLNVAKFPEKTSRHIQYHDMRLNFKKRNFSFLIFKCHLSILAWVILKATPWSVPFKVLWSQSTISHSIPSNDCTETIWLCLSVPIGSRNRQSVHSPKMERWMPPTWALSQPKDQTRSYAEDSMKWFMQISSHAASIMRTFVKAMNLLVRSRTAWTQKRECRSTRSK